LQKAGEDVFYNGVSIEQALDEAESSIIRDMKNSTFESVESLYLYADELNK
jgi:multiple sugar transport system substrate-binding protein